MEIPYAVTFEFLSRPPLTHRGTVAASEVATCAARAMREARRALSPRGWTSCVFVALERIESAVDDDEPVPDAEAGVVEAQTERKHV